MYDQLRWLVGLTTKGKAIKLLDNSMEGYLQELGGGKDVLNRFKKKVLLRGK